MSLLHEIQAAVIQADTQIAPILLKLRLLASRLGSAPLEEWVKHESEGYPEDATLPAYRVVGVSYTGTFSAADGSGYNNTPIPSALIKTFAGDTWTQFPVRYSISAIDDLLKASANGTGSLTLNTSNLILRLQGKVYPDYVCNSVIGTVARAQLVELQHLVRSRVLELTIALEKSVPEAASIVLGASKSAVQVSSEQVTQVTNQVIYGNVTSISSSGAGATFNVAVQQGNQQSLVDALVQAGITQADADEFGQIVASEHPESKVEPFGTKAKKWIGENLMKAASGVWKVGISVATDVLKTAALKYYGL